MKSIDEVRAIIAAAPLRSCTPYTPCPGWALMNGDEIQVCDDCFAGILDDDNVAQLPEARAKLDDARVGLNILEALVALRNARERLKKARAPQANSGACRSERQAFLRNLRRASRPVQSLYNRTVPDVNLANHPAILSRDTSADVERLQIDAWRRMSPFEKAEFVSQATRDALILALSGIRLRHPGASERECFIRLAALQLGPSIVREVYPDASQILGLHV